MTDPSRNPHTPVPVTPQHPDHHDPPGPATDTTDADAMYHGWPLPDGHIAVIIESPPETYRPLPHQVRHSPAGFNCGYNGNGPRDLALSILTNALDALTSRRGFGMGPDNAQSPGTTSSTLLAPMMDLVLSPYIDHYRTRAIPLPYLRFTEQVVAQLPRNKAWSLHLDDILRWLSSPPCP